MFTYSIIKKSQLEGAKRLDAEYYQPEYLGANKLVENFGAKKLGEMVSLLTDYHANGSYETLKQHVELLDESNYALMVRTVDFENDNFETDVKYVSESAYDFLKKTQMFGSELIINKIGNAGKVYFMPTLDRPVTLGMNQFMLRFKKEFNSAYMYVFLISKVGEKLLSQKITGTVPTSIDKNSVRSINIPIPSLQFQNEIKILLENSYTVNKEAKFLYSQAENLLSEELGLKDYEVEEKLWSVVNFSEVKKASRIDAEYFQSSYNKIYSLIRANGGIKLGELVEMKKGFEPGSEAYQEEGKLFIRVSSLSKDGITDKDQKYLKDDLYQKLKKDYEPKVGEILLTKDATPGIAYVVKEPIEGLIAGGVMRLKVGGNIESEYLALCINSIIGKSQVGRDAGGSIIKHWKPTQIKNFLVPILPKPIQQKIAELVRKSHEARKKAKELLESAKQKVEEMIEK